MESSTDKKGFDLSRELETFQERQELLRGQRQILLALLGVAVKAMGIGDATLKGRVKSFSSVAGKLRKRQQAPEYNVVPPRLDVLTDQVGVRVLLPSLQDCANMAAWLRSQEDRGLWIDPDNKRRDEDVLGDDVFGYRSEHLIVAVDPNGTLWKATELEHELSALDVSLRAQLFTISNSTGKPTYRAEIQLRTYAAHAWAIMAHDPFYKGEEKPRDLKRSAAHAAALLESADRELSRLRSEVVAYETSVISLRSPSSIEVELEDLAALIPFAKGHDLHTISLRKARLHRALGAWEPALDALQKCDKSKPGTKTEEIALRAYQAAESPDAEASRQRVADELFNDIDLSSEMHNADCCCDIAEACLLLHKELRQHHAKMALNAAERALELEPRSPRAFRNYLLACLLDSSNILETLRLLQAKLQSALDLSLEHAQQHIYAPWSYFDAAIFSYLKWYFDTTENRRETRSNSEGQVDKEFLATCNLLLAGIELWRCPCDKDGQRPSTGERPQPYPLLVLANQFDLLIEGFDRHVPSELEFLRDIVALAHHVHCCNSSPGDTLSLLSLRSQNSPPLMPTSEAPKRVIILAGTCDQRQEALLDRDYRKTLSDAFTDFNGVIVSGGTLSGISKLAYECGSGPELLRLGYINPNRPYYLQNAWPREHLASVPGTSRAPFEILAYWRDALRAGFHPLSSDRNLQLLGIDGGPISAFEYKLAIALGTRTGIFEDRELLRIRDDSSVSAWKAIANDPLWSKAPNFLPLIKDPDIPYVFIRTPTSDWPPVKSVRESLAQLAHENYRSVVREYMGTLDDAYKPWTELSKDFQLSSAAQVAGLQIILQRGGLYLVPEADAERLLASGTYERVDGQSATEDEIETIARAEHARWCVEKLEGGWRYGKRDNLKKLRPQLVSWRELVRNSQPNETDKDRSVIRNLTKTLAVLKDGELPHVLLRRKKTG